MFGYYSSANETKVQPDLKLPVKPGQVNARNVINVSLQNPQAAYLNHYI